MIITDSAILMSSSRTAVERDKEEESLVYWKKGRDSERLQHHGGEGKLKKLAEKITENEAVQVKISQEARHRKAVRGEAGSLDPEDRSMYDLKTQLLKALIERLTGREIKIYEPGNLVSEGEVPDDVPAAVPEEDAAMASEGWGLEYQYLQSHYEYESTSFTASGTIRTADGQEISFDLSLNMSREFYSEQSLSIKAGDALKDPLVINFSGTAAQLTQTSFQFDLDMDGSEDQLRFVGPGSGFLALDRNNDGIITDGSELFGARTGDGFNELAAFDEDGNGWIDENDVIYSRLRIWSQTMSGERQLFALGAKNIGAIYLGHETTPFTLKDENNETQGQIRSTGVFLGNDGQVGTVQQLDMKI
ncbi:hypothetical protein GF1_28480 [Desulfolithobacter dissulfuricans]|uniref:VCBS repeat-containing protein n=1 Tax=Desulfolithobacter dissulfuricans TaxID=2795293 RepID=A0A915U477_9BACT|nr:hypothetical protein [Desulfolithobacter dissulfuricans]BCO10472.1 hypothetical protein GF1_28480 [Desulfolithobacter dissulfuricans]